MSSIIYTISGEQLVSSWFVFCRPGSYYTYYKLSYYSEPVLKEAFHSFSSGGDEAATWTSYVGKMFSAASSYFPAQVSGMMSQDRAFATVHLLTSGRKNVCTLAM